MSKLSEGSIMVAGRFYDVDSYNTNDASTNKII